MVVKRVIVAIGLLLALVLASGATWFLANKGATTASRPVVICGQALYSGAVGVPVYSPYSDATGSHAPVASQGPIGVTATTPILFQLSVDCDRGAVFSIYPAGLVRIENEIVARNGWTVAVALIGVKAGRATLTLQSGGQSGWSASFLVLGSN
jgi:hypothetical protein